MLVADTKAGPVLAIIKSATGMTVVITGGLVLFVGFGSPVGVATLAKLVSVPLAGAVTVNVTLLTTPFARLPKFHVTMPLFVVPPPVALTNATPTGSVSVTMTPLALDGPKFVTEMV